MAIVGKYVGKYRNTETGKWGKRGFPHPSYPTFYLVVSGSQSDRLFEIGPTRVRSTDSLIFYKKNSIILGKRGMLYISLNFFLKKN